MNMDISLIIKVAGIGILISVLNMLLEKTDRKDWAPLTTLAGVIIVLGMVLTEISDLFNTVRTMFQLY
jgi:stage III sporulation protein AC